MVTFRNMRIIYIYSLSRYTESFSLVSGFMHSHDRVHFHGTLRVTFRLLTLGHILPYGNQKWQKNSNNTLLPSNVLSPAQVYTRVLTPMDLPQGIFMRQSRQDNCGCHQGLKAMMQTAKSLRALAFLHTPPSLSILWPQLWSNLSVTSLSHSSKLCESRGGRPGLAVLTSLMVSVDVKLYWTMLRHWSQLVPNMSSDIRGH